MNAPVFTLIRLTVSASPGAHCHCLPKTHMTQAADSNPSVTTCVRIQNLDCQKSFLRRLLIWTKPLWRQGQIPEAETKTDPRKCQVVPEVRRSVDNPNEAPVTHTRTIAFKSVYFDDFSASQAQGRGGVDIQRTGSIDAKLMVSGHGYHRRVVCAKRPWRAEKAISLRTKPI